ncbi:MAG: glycosyltransferase family 39 protein [Nitrosomonadales bacterium]|nr:glycosyltransferase family 39 protein [Nitrosomonadales bacterium]
MGRILYFWLLLIAVALIWFANLEYRTLIKPDEGRYAEIPREMVASGDWVTPRLNDLKYFEKPPLQYWATATAYTLFGEHQWTSRLWTGLTGFAGILLVWFAGLRLFGRETAGYAALLLSSSLLYVMMGHINTLDMGVTFFLTLGIAGLSLSEQEYGSLQNRREQAIKASRNWMLVAWAALALAVLSKGLMGLVLPGAALFIYCIVQRDFSVLKRMHWLPGLAVFLAITVPWFLLVMKANPEFFERFFIYEHYTRFTTKDLGRYQPWYYFIPILLAGALPWTVLMFDAMWRTLRSRKPPDTIFDAQRFLLIWAVFIYVFFSISGSKLPSYLLPMLPALALLMGKRIAGMNVRVLFWQVAPVIPVLLLFMGLAANVDKLADTPSQAALYPHYGPWLATAAMVSLAGLLAGMLLLWREKKPVAVVVLAVTALLSAQIGLSGYNTVAQERSAKHIAEAIRGEVTADIPFYSVMTYEQTLPFYLQRTFTLVQYQDEMAFGIQQEPHRWIPTIEEFAKVWAEQREALAIMPVYAYAQLQQLAASTSSGQATSANSGQAASTSSGQATSTSSGQGLEMEIIFEDAQHIVIKKPLSAANHNPLSLEGVGERVAR